MFAIICLIGFGVPIVSGRGIVRRIIATIVVYGLILIDAAEKNVYFIHTSVQLRESMFFISMFIIIICLFLQRYQYHVYLTNAYINFQASLDELTSCCNRKGGQRLFERYVRTGKGVHGVIMLDIDYFKMYNDTLGHADRALYQAKENGRNQVVIAD